MDPIFKFPASPGTPLFPVSPERANRQQLPQSPSLPHLSHLQDDPFKTLHSRGNSDVQGKVAQFNNLSKEAAQRRKNNEAALRRAVLGREEAEGEARRLRDANDLLRQDVEEGVARERRVGERLEGVMEQLQQSKGTQAHAQSIYEKEVRRARKDAFKSSSMLVKMQEELKSARNRYTLMREEAEAERRNTNEKEKETFAGHYQLVGLQEEIDTLRQQMKIVEDEREALKTNLKEGEVAEIAAEGAIALPASGESDGFASRNKKRNRTAERESLKENVDPRAPEIEEELLMAKDELRLEKRMRLRADEQVHFLKMECQFGICSCRIAEQQGIEYVHDNSLAVAMAEVAKQIAHTFGTPVIDTVEENVQDDPAASDVKENIQERPSTPIRQSSDTSKIEEDAQEQRPSPHRQTTEQLISFSPTTGTFYRAPSPTRIASMSLPEFAAKTIPAPTPNPENTSSPPLQQQQPEEELWNQVSPSPVTLPHTPRPLPIPPTLSRTVSHTISTTTLVPLKIDPLSPAPQPPTTPGVISREEALEQIRLRRGRARSIAAGNGTPRKPVLGMEGWTPRREISAPVGRGV